MTDAEWAMLAPYVTFRHGRPPRDPRATWDAIFWVACSDRPWAALPPDLGRPDTCHSALAYAARKGILDRLLLLVSRHPFASEEMECLEWRIVRCVRRMSRQLPPETLLMARELGLESALYCEPALIARPPASIAAWPARPLRLPRVPRRALRGAPPSRGFAPKPAPPAPVPLPAQPRRAARPLRPCGAVTEPPTARKAMRPKG